MTKYWYWSVFSCTVRHANFFLFNIWNKNILLILRNIQQQNLSKFICCHCHTRNKKDFATNNERKSEQGYVILDAFFIHQQFSTSNAINPKMQY